MKYFFTTFRYLHLEMDTREYMELIPGVQITNNLKIINEFLSKNY